MWVSTTKLAKIEGVNQPKQYDEKIENGHYERVKQTSGGHFRVFVNQQRKICYARVSSGKQRSSIDAQKRILLQKHPDAEFVSDIASAFNFKRKRIAKPFWNQRCAKTQRILWLPRKIDLPGQGLSLSNGSLSYREDMSKFWMTRMIPVSLLIPKSLSVFITSFCNSHYGKTLR